jgi:NAD(P)-dependent dehydrogenase (short-subunit alcohol dehydrogenase family)
LTTERREMLEERCGLITGAATGIGRATARLMADYGASVVVADVDDEGGEETCRLIREAATPSSSTAT